MKGLASCFPIFILCTLNSCLQILYTSHDCSWRCLKGGEANIRRIIWSFFPFFEQLIRDAEQLIFHVGQPTERMAALPNCHSVHLILTYLCIYTQTQIEFPLAPHFIYIKMRTPPPDTHTHIHPRGSSSFFVLFMAGKHF